MLDYEYATSIAELLLLENPKLIDEKWEALQKIYGRARGFLNHGFLEKVVCGFFRKKAAMILAAKTKGELAEILKPNEPHYNGVGFVPVNCYAVEEEELMLWSLTSLKGPILPEAYDRFMELFRKILPEEAEQAFGKDKAA